VRYGEYSTLGGSPWWRDSPMVMKIGSDARDAVNPAADDGDAVRGTGFKTRSVRPLANDGNASSGS
jgi:hypothetical protein